MSISRIASRILARNLRASMDPKSKCQELAADLLQGLHSRYNREELVEIFNTPAVKGTMTPLKEIHNLLVYAITDLANAWRHSHGFGGEPRLNQVLQNPLVRLFKGELPSFTEEEANWVRSQKDRGLYTLTRVELAKMAKRLGASEFDLKHTVY